MPCVVTETLSDDTRDKVPPNNVPPSDIDTNQGFVRQM